MASQYTYRLRAPKGLDATLIKDLRWQLKLASNKETKALIREIPGRKSIEVKGSQELLWKLLTSSRIAEDIQIKVCRSFLARGEKELKTGLQKVPWHCYIPTDKRHLNYALPKIDCKTHKSKLFHSKLARNILMGHITDLPIQRAFKCQPPHLQRQYKEFKQRWLAEHDKTRTTEPAFKQA